MQSTQLASKILIVEDDLDFLRPLKIGLKLERFEVDAFQNPVQAVSEFSKGKYDLALIDTRLPVMDGITLSKELLKIDPDLKICFVSAYSDTREKMRQIPALSHSFYIRKPITVSELIAKFRHVLPR